MYIVHSTWYLVHSVQNVADHILYIVYHTRRSKSYVGRRLGTGAGMGPSGDRWPSPGPVVYRTSPGWGRGRAGPWLGKARVGAGPRPAPGPGPGTHWAPIRSLLHDDALLRGRLLGHSLRGSCRGALRAPHRWKRDKCRSGAVYAEGTLASNR